MSEKFIFHSEELSKAIKKADPLFSNLKKRLDQIASDIKTLESYLMDSSINLSHSVLVSSWDQYDEEDIDLGKKYQAVEYGTNAYLCWGLYSSGKSSSYRLFIQFESIGGFVEDKPFTKLVLQTKVPLRIKAHSMLPVLIEGLSQKISEKEEAIKNVGTLKDSLQVAVEEFDEIPF